MRRPNICFLKRSDDGTAARSCHFCRHLRWMLDGLDLWLRSPNGKHTLFDPCALTCFSVSRTEQTLFNQGQAGSSVTLAPVGRVYRFNINARILSAALALLFLLLSLLIPSIMLTVFI